MAFSVGVISLVFVCPLACLSLSAALRLSCYELVPVIRLKSGPRRFVCHWAIGVTVVCS